MYYRTMQQQIFFAVHLTGISARAPQCCLVGTVMCRNAEAGNQCRPSFQLHETMVLMLDEIWD